MSIFKLLSTLTIGLSLQALPAIAKTPLHQSEPAKNAASADADSGVIGNIDAVKGRIVISDRTYVFSPLRLIVHESRRTAGVTSLRANQEVRFVAAQGRPGMPLTSAWTITEIWINEK